METRKLNATALFDPEQVRNKAGAPFQVFTPFWRHCLTLPVECEGADIRTVEGMAEGPRLHPLQQAFAELGAAQCGYCTPGFLLAAEALIREKGAPTRAEVAEALAGNLCRCTGYLKIFEAVELAAARMRGAEAKAPAEREVVRG